MAARIGTNLSLEKSEHDLSADINAATKPLVRSRLDGLPQVDHGLVRNQSPLVTSP
jgi:hypothetical protein